MKAIKITLLVFMLISMFGIADIFTSHMTKEQYLDKVNFDALVEADSYNHEVRFRDGLRDDFDFTTVAENRDIRIFPVMMVTTNMDMVRFEVWDPYNLNAWANENYDNYAQWSPEKFVQVIIFIFDSKSRLWVGGTFDYTLLSTHMFARLENIYSPQVYRSWPQFKKRISPDVCLKMCLYDPVRNQRSNFIYNDKSLTRIPFYAEEDVRRPNNRR